jgi:hypothetical protein
MCRGGWARALRRKRTANRSDKGRAVGFLHHALKAEFVRFAFDVRRGKHSVEEHRNFRKKSANVASGTDSIVPA